MSANTEIVLLDNVDATVSHTTPEHDITHINIFSLQIIPSGLSKNYKITIQVSNVRNPTASDWSFYKLNDVAIDKDINEFIYDELLPASYFRVKYNDNGNASGTVKMVVNFQRD